MIPRASRTWISRFRHDNAGASLVEFSLLLPMLVIMMAGMGEFGRAIYQFHVADKGVKAASRYLARVPGAGGGTCPAASAEWTASQTPAKTLAQRGSFDTNDAHSLSNWTDPNTVLIGVDCFDNSAGTYYGVAQIPRITVSTSFTFNDLGMLSILQLPTITITAAHQEMHIGD